MADHFLQLFAVGELRKALIHPLVEHTVQQLGLLAGFVPHAHGIVHNNDGQHSRNGKGRGTDAAVTPGGNHHRTDGGRVRAGHTACAPHTLCNKAMEDEKIQQYLDKLGQQRCTDRRDQHEIPTQRSAQQWHRNHILISYVPAALQPSGAENLPGGQAHPARPALRRCGARLFRVHPAGRTA